MQKITFQKITQLHKASTDLPSISSRYIFR